MCAVKSDIKSSSLTTDKIKEIMGKIREKIPLGKNSHKEIQQGVPSYSFDSNVIKKEWELTLKQLGTLGGGNHFIEIQKDEDDIVWIMIHSGSRHLGKAVCDHYHKLAVSLNEKWYSEVPKEHQLAFLPIETEEAKHYFDEMNFCVDYALANRKLMMNRIIDSFIEVGVLSSISGVVMSEAMINVAHNYARFENHFGKNVIVHRKGATSARLRELGIIPGSQGTKSYIVRGLGNKESFESCSHGAGRKMSRTRAENELNLEQEKKILDDQGIVHGIREQRDLDEASGAYKDISIVMEQQKDLVEIVTELSPVAVIKA
jgi:tRNA-splicing ligase RtcB